MKKPFLLARAFTATRYSRVLIAAFLLLGLFLWVQEVEFIYGIPPFFKYILSVFLLSILFLYRFSNPSTTDLPIALRVVEVLFIVWSLFLLALSFDSDMFYLQKVLGQRYFFIPFLIPILVVTSRFSLFFFRVFIKVSSRLLFLAVGVQFTIIISGLDVEQFYEHLHRIWIFEIGGGLVLLISHFLKQRWVTYVTFLYFILQVYISAYYGLRGLMIESILFLASATLLRLVTASSTGFSKIKITLGVLLVILLVSMTSDYFVGTFYVFEKGFNEHAFEESRGRVFEDFFKDFSKPTDWLFGRGLNGTVLRTIQADSRVGTVIENGFLFTILKGGLLYLLPMLFMFIRSSFLGFFRSNNDLSKALASVSFIFVLVMFAFNLPDCSTKYILTWIAVTVNSDSSFRAINNTAISYYLNR